MKKILLGLFILFCIKNTKAAEDSDDDIATILAAADAGKVPASVAGISETKKASKASETKDSALKRLKAKKIEDTPPYVFDSDYY